MNAGLFPCVASHLLIAKTPDTSRRRDGSSCPRRSTITPRLPPVVLPREEDRRFSQDLPLHPQRRVLIPQALELLALVAREPAWALTARGVLLLEPVAQRHVRDPQRLRQRPLRLITKPSETDRLPTEFLGIRRSCGCDCRRDAGSRSASPRETIRLLAPVVECFGDENIVRSGKGGSVKPFHQSDETQLARSIPIGNSP
jgi:hypothetical protein